MDDTLRLVVVDDDADFAESLALSLQQNGHQARTARDGQTALLLVETFRPHCVLLDLKMPGMSGAELARLLRRHYADIVLIAITADTTVNPMLAPEIEHVDYCLHKPVEFAKLAKLLPLPLVMEASK